MANDRKMADQLDEMRARMVARDAGRQAYHDVLDRLSRSGAIERTKHEGERIEPFVLPDAEGRLVALEDLVARGPIVLAFFRGDWCPYCRITMTALNEVRPAIEAAGASLVGVVPDTGGIALAAKRALGLAFPLLCDVDHGLGAAFGLTFPMPESYRRRLTEQGIDLGQRHGHGGWFVPMPGCFVIDAEGVIRYAFVDIDYTRRPETAEVVAAVRGITDPPTSGRAPD